MPVLILTRHAKSDWSHDDLSDHARPLNARGRAAAPLVGKALAARGHIPDQVLCSSAARTQQTWDGLSTAWGTVPNPTLIHSLYHAAPDTMLDILREATGSTVAMIAHNPGIAALAGALVTTAPEHPRFRHFPTGATLIADVPDWATLVPGTAKALDFFVPRDLPDHP